MATQDSKKYSVPAQAKILFQTGILQNPLVEKHLPMEASEVARNVYFEGSDSPSLPINWRFAESISALMAYQATIVNILLIRKYGTKSAKVTINTDHAQLFLMSSFLWILDPNGDELNAGSILQPAGRDKLAKDFPDWDKHGTFASFYRGSTTNIYRTKDDSFFHIHGSLNPSLTLNILDLPSDMNFAAMEESWAPFQEAIAKRTADEMQKLVSQHGQAGTICWTSDEYKSSQHGQANAHVGLFEILPQPSSAQSPCWWPDATQTSASRPLAGLKVVDLTRVIAGPTVSRGLAELGASVMRITAPHLADTSALHPDLNHGKWNACLDLRQEEDRKVLRDLVLEADVFLEGYRPGVLDKYGFGEKDVLEMCREHGRGIIYCCEDCYGWQGPWAHLSGWQQISDANCGVSYEYGRAMGNDEPVTPAIPNSDYCTGVIGTVAILTALLQRAEKGGSFTVKIALNYYSQWLVKSCGMYPSDVWEELWQRNGSPVFRHYHAMQYTLPRVFEMLQKYSADKLFRPEFFTQYYAKSIGKDLRIVAPILQFPNGEVKPGFSVGTRSNGVDQPKWPTDLGVEVVV